VKRLADVPPDAVLPPTGTNLWRADQLPSEWRKAVERRDGARPDFGWLRESLAMLSDRQKPTPTEAAWFWGQVFELHEADASNGLGPEELLQWLARECSWLTMKRESLRAEFYRKFSRWVQGGKIPSALLDGRPLANRAKRFQIPKADRDRIERRAVFQFGGDLAPAWREVQERCELSETLSERYITNPARKSYLPRAVRRLVSEVKLLDDIHHGPRQARLNGAHITRDWSEVPAWAWYQSDDCTLPVYYYVPNGAGWWTLTRGQWLPMIDLRSKRILDFALLDSKSYDSLSIRTLITKVCNRYGLPRRGFYFERGIWQKSRLLKGVSSDCPSWPAVEVGLRGLGLEFVHANLARSKPIENILGLLQNEMEGEPGYVGRNEMTEKFERVQRAKLDVEARRLDPAKAGFLSGEAWFTRLHEICAQYNARPQESAMTCGLSPNNASVQFDNKDDPAVAFPPECRYLLATHRRPVVVGKNGAVFTIGKRQFVYRSEQTGELVGQRMLLWFDPECPDTATLTTMNREKPFSVPLAKPVPAMDATREQMAEAQASVAAHNSFAKRRYSELKSVYASGRRAMIADRATVELGRTMASQGEEMRQLGRAEDRAARLSARLGMAVRPGTLEDDAKLAGMAEWLRAHNTLPEAPTQ